MSADAFATVHSLHATERVTIDGGSIEVTAVSYAGADRPVYISVGPLGMCATLAEALALGDAIIRMAHHYQAALAEYRSVQAAQGVES